MRSTPWPRARAPLRCPPGDRVGIAMRNYPEWVVSSPRSSRLARSASRSTPGGPRASWTTASTTRDVGPDRRRRTRRRASGPCERANVRVMGVRLDALEPSRGRGALGRRRGWPVWRCRTSPSTPTPRDAPLHLGHDRFPQGRGLDPRGHQPGGDGLRLRARSSPTRRGLAWPAGRATVLHPHRPALPRHRLHPRHAVVLHLALQAGGDVPVGTRPGAWS